MSSAPNSQYIVIVEDSLWVADALRILFTEHGYRVALAQSVAAAVEACSVDPVYAMLLDLTLPDGDGLDVLLEIDRLGLPRPSRVIAVTGHGGAEIEKRCLAAGCERVMLKPVSIREVLRLIQS